MELSDFFIGKPGPGSISEALAKKLPVIVQRNAWTMAHELYNTRWVEELGAGTWSRIFPARSAGRSGNSSNPATTPVTGNARRTTTIGRSTRFRKCLSRFWLPPTAAGSSRGPIRFRSRHGPRAGLERVFTGTRDGPDVQHAKE
jgi:hypothetical protein